MFAGSGIYVGLGAITSTFAGELAVALGVAAAVVFLLRAVHIPDVIAFVAAGVVLGESGIGGTARTEAVHGAVEISALVLVFLAGAGMRLDRLAQAGRYLRPAVVQPLVVAAVTAAVLLWVGLSWKASVFTAFLACLGGTVLSPARSPFKSRAARNGDASAQQVTVLQSVPFVAMLLFLPVLAGVDDAWPAFGAAVFTFAAFGTVGLVLAHSFVPNHVERALRRRGGPGAAVVMIMIVSVVVLTMTLAGLGVATAALLAGLLFSGSRWRGRPMDEAASLRKAACAVLLVALGVLLDLQFVAEHIGWLAAASIGLLVIRTASLRLLSGRMLPGRTVTALAPTGEMAVLLFYAGRSLEMAPAGLAGAGDAAFVAVLVLMATSVALYRSLLPVTVRARRVLARTRLGSHSLRRQGRRRTKVHLFGRPPAGSAPPVADPRIVAVDDSVELSDAWILNRRTVGGAGLALVAVQHGAPGCLKSVEDLALHRRIGVSVLAVWRGDVCFVEPDAGHVFEARDKILLSGSQAMLQVGVRLFRRMPSSAPPEADGDLED